MLMQAALSSSKQQNEPKNKMKRGPSSVDAAGQDKGKERQGGGVPARDYQNNGRDAFDEACIAIAKGDLDKTMQWLEEGVDLGMTDLEDRTLLHVACAAGHLHIVEYLVQAGADPHARDSNQNTPIKEANAQKQHEIVAYLRTLSKGSAIDGPTWIHGVADGKVDTVREYIEKGADIHYEDSNKRTALHIAAYKGYRPIVKLLLANGANVDAEDRWKQTPIDSALAKDHTEIASYLRSVKARAKAREMANWAQKINTAAARNDMAELKRLLARPGATANCQDREGRTPLHKAVNKGHLEVVTYLLKKQHVDVNVIDNQKHTPLDQAIVRKNEQIVELLKDHGAKRAWKLTTGPSEFRDINKDMTGPYLPVRKPQLLGSQVRQRPPPPYHSHSCIIA
eukprot:TRINITY_DN2404_c0_g2_i1.p1 TRINITY_DN2404_c0_g2~~TRINITY_DN2404_c0_g2_i1.p1  ORF type:complete len:396 (+),score=69.76 TRINITY_DN2404_c0_g2_i1:80-1267(+)